MSIINLDEVGIEPGQIMADGVRQWRPDCKAGQFKIGATNMQGARLDMELIAAQSHYGSLFGYEPMEWIGLLFVDNDGSLSSILFKTESRDNFLELHRTAKLSGESILGKVVCGRMAKRTGREGGSYYAVEFEFLDRPTRFSQAIIDFKVQNFNCHDMIQFRETADIESKSQILAAVRAAA